MVHRKRDSVKNIDDLITSAASIHARYNANRIERETVREWVLGLGGYPSPYAEAIAAAAAWFKPARTDISAEALKVQDLDCLQTIATAHQGMPMSRQGGAR